MSATTNETDAAEVCEVVVTGPREWLPDFVRGLVADRLVACGQHVMEIRSIYRWQGAIEDEPEARVALHTRRSLVQAIIERTGRDHPDDVPCVIALPIAAGLPAYVDWVLSETVDPLAPTRRNSSQASTPASIARGLGCGAPSGQTTGVPEGIRPLG
jgi:periplasmic divalent cation tolerance protein